MSDGASYWNPFYDNHLFTKEDMKRCKLTFSDKVRMFFKPMLVQINEGYAIHFKLDNYGAIYIYKFEDISKSLRKIADKQLKELSHAE